MRRLSKQADAVEFRQEYVRLLSGISMLAVVTERHCLSPQGEFSANDGGSAHGNSQETNLTPEEAMASAVIV